MRQVFWFSTCTNDFFLKTKFLKIFVSQRRKKKDERRKRKKGKRKTRDVRRKRKERSLVHSPPQAEQSAISTAKLVALRFIN